MNGTSLYMSALRRATVTCPAMILINSNCAALRKSGIAALHRVNADSSLVVGERKRVEAAHAGIRKILFKFCARLFALIIDHAVAFGYINLVIGTGHPLEDILQNGNAGFTSNKVLNSGNGFQRKFSVFL